MRLNSFVAILGDSCSLGDALCTAGGDDSDLRDPSTRDTTSAAPPPATTRADIIPNE